MSRFGFSASKLAFWLLAGVNALAMTACKKSGNAGGSSQAVVSDEAQQARSLYAKGFNQLIDDPKEMIDTYFKAMPKSGLTKKKVSLYSSHTFAKRSIDAAKSAFVEARGIDSVIVKRLAPLADGAMQGIEKALKAFTDAYNYYDAEDFKDDGGKKGQQLYKQMQAAAVAFDKSLSQLGDALSAIEDEQTLAQLKKMEKDQGSLYWLRLYTFRAKKTVDTMRNTKRYAAAFSELEKVHADLAKFAKTHTKKAFASFTGQANSFFNKAKSLKRNLGGKDGKALQASAKQLITGYNTLVQVGNALAPAAQYGTL